MDNDLKWLAENLEEWEYDDYNLVRLDPAQRLWYAKEEKRIYRLEEYYTREQWGQARKELGLDKEWKSLEDGLPPVGTVLENWAGQKRTVVAHDQGSIVCRIGDQKGSYIAYSLEEIDESLMPALTEEDKAVENMLDVVGEAGGNLSESTARILYRKWFIKTKGGKEDA